MELEGFGIFVEDMPTMIRFYRDILGFEITEDESTENVYLKKDGVLFLMYGRKDFEKMTSHPYSYAKNINGHFEIALCIENYSAVDKAFEDVVSKGATIIMKPTTESWGQRTCYISYPEGNLIEIGSFTK